MVTNSKQDFEKLAAAAARIIQVAGGPAVIDAVQGEARYTLLRGFADQLVDETGCSLSTARRHIARALRRARHPEEPDPARGGYRPGAGRKPMEHIEPFTLIEYHNGIYQGFWLPPVEAIQQAGGPEKVRGYRIGHSRSVVNLVGAGIEISRTNAGSRLPYEEALRRVQVEVKNVRILMDGADEIGAVGEVWTKTDDDNWVNEGEYVMSTDLEWVRPPFLPVV